MMDALNRLLHPIRRRLDNMIARAVVRATNDAGGLRVVQFEALRGEVRGGVEHFQEYGFTSRPLPGAELVALFLGGVRDHPLVVASGDRRYRKRGLAPGEVALYTHEGDFVHLKNGRIVQVVAGAKLDVTAPEVLVTAATKVTIDTPLAEITGNVQIGGNLDVAGNAAVGGTGTVAGALTAQGGLAVSGGSGASVAGDMAVSGGDVSADGISLKQHTHQGDSGGTTGPAQ